MLAEGGLSLGLVLTWSPGLSPGLSTGLSVGFPVVLFPEGPEGIKLGSLLLFMLKPLPKTICWTSLASLILRY